ncbi:MAG: hypothetical protein IJX78_06075 [Bacilli bacterium]|nr:hypothetical protein [Bacilli bacterium]
MLNSDPLMFIESAHVNVSSKSKTVFDSRYDLPKKKEEEILSEPKEISKENLDKLDSILDLYHISKPVVCKIVTSSSSYEGIPFQKENDNLVIKQNGFDTVVNINDIEDIMILRI